MTLKIELRCILFPLIILEMFLQLDWQISVDWTLFGNARTCLFKVPQLTVHVRAQTKTENHQTFSVFFGRSTKLSNRGRRALVRKVTKNLLVTLTELQHCLVKRGECSRRTTISAALHQSGLYGKWPDGSHSSKRHMTARLEFAKRHLKDSRTIRN